MRREDIQDIVRRVPAADASLTVLTLRNGNTLTIDTVIRFEPTYLVMRGREGGTTDEGRAFFVPYDDVSYIKVDRSVKSVELRRIYGENVALDAEEQIVADAAAITAAADATAAATADGQPILPAAAVDPATLAKQKLLARIRAARTSTSGPAKPGG